MRRRCGGLDCGRSIAPAFLRSANRACDENGPHDKGIRPPGGRVDQPAPPASGDVIRAPRSCSPAAATSRSRRWACSRALLERDIVPDVIVGCSAGAFNGATIAASPSLRGRRAARGDLGVAPRRRGVPRGPAVAGVEPPHPGRPPLLQPGPAGHLRAGRHRRHLRGAGDPAAGGGRRPRHRRRGGVRPRPARARAARQRRAAGHLPADPPRRPHPGRRRGRRHRARCGTPSPGRSTGST